MMFVYFTTNKVRDLKPYYTIRPFIVNPNLKCRESYDRVCPFREPRVRDLRHFSYFEHVL